MLEAGGELDHALEEVSPERGGGLGQQHLQDHRPRLLESTPITRDVWLAGTPKEEIAAVTNAALGPATVQQDLALAEVANSLA